MYLCDKVIMMREAIEFYKWCDEPIFDENCNYVCRRVTSQAPEYNSYLVKDENNHHVWPKGEFPSIEEIYGYWIKYYNNEY